MKKLLIIIAVSALGFTACKKCANCTTTVTTKTTGQPAQTAISTGELCGDDLEEMDGYHNVATATYQGYTSTITTSCECQ